MDMETRINGIAKEAIEATKMEANFYGSTPTVDSFLIELDIILMQFSFENQASQSTFETLVKKEVSIIDPIFYETIYPPCFMDCNGVYTNAPELFA